MKTKSFLLVVLLSVAAPATLQAAPPLNDSFEKATLLTGRAPVLTNQSGAKTYSITLSDGDAGGTATETVAATTPAPEKLILRLNLNTGVFTGSLLPPGATKPNLNDS